ncbi:hypothetical protein J4E91_008479 [Alternaria rosae]|nr:hypothetical protein J4E91_008479 [Alternaria rosae]
MPASGERSNSAVRFALLFVGTVAAFAFLWVLIAPAKHPEMAQPISILSISQNRAVVRTIHDYVKPHGYVVAGILESDPFSAKELALALRVLEPAPQVVVIGRGYSGEEATESRKVYNEFAKSVGVKDGIVIKITDEIFDEVGKEGIPAWVLKELQAHFDK